MTQKEAEKLALGLMSEHNLNWPAWGFRMTRHKLLLGRCVHNRYNGGTIELSKNYLHLSYEEIRDTLLHEIAHALCGPGEGHGAAWKRMCIKIGAKPNPRADLREKDNPEFKWTGLCPSNHKIQRHALTEKGRRMACGQCCRELNGGQFSGKYLFEWHLTADLKAAGVSGVRLLNQPEAASQEPTRISEIMALQY